MRKLLFCVAMLLLAAARAAGQAAEVWDESAAKSSPPPFDRSADVNGEAARLLKSAAYRERAWGAYLAGRHGLKGQAAALLEIVADPSLGEVWEERIVRQAALDALIRLGVKVAADALRPLPSSYSDERIILLAAAPAENRPALLELFSGELSGPSRADARWLAVGNLLAETKAGGFAAALLRELKFEVDVTVVDHDEIVDGAGGGGYGCGCGGGGRPEDFPPVGFYTLSSEATRGAVVVAPGRYPVYYHRTERGEGGCGGLTGYDRDFHRVEYLAGLLDTTADALKLDAHASHTVICKDARQCRRELAGLRRQIEGPYAEAVGGLVEKSLLDASDAAALSPDITFTLRDERRNKTFPLPDKLKGVKLVVEGREEAPTPEAVEQ